MFNPGIFKNIYLFIHDRERERERQRDRQRENQAPCREPDVGLDPRTPGSRPEPKADAQLLSHPGVPYIFFRQFPKVVVPLYSPTVYSQNM